MSEEWERLKLELFQAVEERYSKKLDSFSQFAEMTYSRATQNFDWTVKITGIVVVVASFLGYSSLQEIDKKIQAAVDKNVESRLQSTDLQKKIEEASLKERRQLLTADLEQRILSVELKRRLQQAGTLGKYQAS
jgi:tyrosine-protein phosphatase YwqE